MPGLMHGHLFSCSLVHLFKLFSGPHQELSHESTRGSDQVFIPLQGSCYWVCSRVLLLLLLLLQYFHTRMVVFHLTLSHSKSLQISRIILCIVADPTHAVIWMVSILFSDLLFLLSFFKSLKSVLNSPTSNGSIFLFYSFCVSQVRSNICYSLSIFLHCGLTEQQNRRYSYFSHYLKLGLVFLLGLWDLFVLERIPEKFESLSL